MKSAGIFLIALMPLSASTISSFSTSNGTPYTVSYDSFSATEANMAGRLSITAEFGANSLTCNWTNGAPPATPDCLSAGNFSVSFTNGANTYPTVDNGFWTIINLSGNALTAITFNGVVGAGNGVAFDRCMSGVATFNNTDSNCGYNGTVGSDRGWTANGRGDGTTSATAAVTYSNILSLSGSAPVGDAYGVMRLVFSGSFLNTTNHNSFTFNADADLVNAAIATPEPGSLALLGSGLAGLAFLARRRRRQ
jgi:hypothetical protein